MDIWQVKNKHKLILGPRKSIYNKPTLVNGAIKAFKLYYQSVEWSLAKAHVYRFNNYIR